MPSEGQRPASEDPNGEAAGIVLSRQELDACVEGRRHAIVNVPGVGRLRVQSLTALELREVSVWAASDGKAQKIDEMLITRCVVGPDGDRQYRTSEVDAGTFDAWDAAIVRGLGDVIDRFTGYRQEAFDITHAIEAKKN